MRKNDGNTIAEYIVLGGLMGVVMIASLLFLGGNLGGVFTGLKAELLSEGSGPGGGNGLGAGGGGDFDGAIDGLSGQVLTLADGTEIHVSGLPNNMGELVETVGANGTTTKLAQSIQDLAVLLLDSGEIDEAQYQSLKELADKGHLMASTMEAIMNAAANHKGEMGMEFHYQTYDLEATDGDGNYVVYSGIGAGEVTLSRLGAGEHSYVSDMYNIMAELSDAGALNNPAVASLVHELTDSIAQTAYIFVDRYEETAYYSQAKTGDTFVKEVSGSDDKTHDDSGMICVVGGDKANGQGCHKRNKNNP